MDKTKLKETLNKQQTIFNTTITRLINAINENEKALLATWDDRFSDFKNDYNQVREGWEITLDLKSQAIEKELENLRSSTPSAVSVEPRKLVIELFHSELDKTSITINAQHKMFPDLLLDLRAGHNLYNYGPTGSGKTVAVFTAAKVLSLPVYRIVLNRETSPYNFHGYMKDSSYVPGIAFKPYTEGGILFIDELDNGNANATTSIKNYADADECWFPHGIFPKHKDFRIVANANTIGNGANQSYIGRNQQDKALLNIFKFHFWDYDEEFEAQICWQEYLSCGGKPEDKLKFESFLKGLRDFRRAIAELGILHIISPRNLKQASKDFALGRSPSHITETIILKGLDEGQSTKIIEKVKSYYPKKLRKETMDNLWNGEN